MVIIGLTGGIATGKSTVSKMFEDYGIPVIDTDIIARNLLRKGTQTYDEIIKSFGNDVLLTNGDISRKHLAKIIFEDEEQRIKLNQLTHPKVKEEVFSSLEKYRRDHVKFVLVDVPLLFESKFNDIVDIIIVVSTTRDKQIERLIDRDKISKEYAITKIQSQMSLQEKEKRADYIIDNSASIIQTKNEFLRIMEELEVT